METLFLIESKHHSGEAASDQYLTERIGDFELESEAIGTMNTSIWSSEKGDHEGKQQIRKSSLSSTPKSLSIGGGEGERIREVNYQKYTGHHKVKNIPSNILIFTMEPDIS